MYERRDENLKNLKNLGRLVGYPSAKMDRPKRQETKVKQMAV